MRERFSIKLLVVVCLFAGLLTLSGCSVPRLTLTPQELYSLPTLPAKYTELNTQLETMLVNGAEYAAPTSGTNIQPVQLVDLDGDGREEAVAFFRNAGDERPLKICIFSATEEHYQLSEMIEGSGNAIYSIVYEDLNDDGRRELAVGWKAATDLQVLEIYGLHPQGEAKLLLQSNYVKYITADLDGDRKKEVIVLHADEEGEGIADYYAWAENISLTRQSSARISSTMAELSRQGRVTVGALRENVPALFVTGVTNTPSVITDILTLENGELSNIVLSEVTGVSSQIAPYDTLYPTDINGDGLTEIPVSTQLLSLTEDGLSYKRTDWYSYDRTGKAAVGLRTYHNQEDGWYFRLPETWLNRIWVSRMTMAGTSNVTFCILGEEGAEPIPFLRIAAITGQERELQALRGDSFILSRQQETVYTAELLEANDSWQYGLTADEVRQAFSLIATEWVSGDN